MIDPRRLILASVTLVVGCAARPTIPTYPAMSVDASLAAMGERAARLAGATGKGAVTLGGKGRDSVRLEAAFVLRPPAEARVRAWKFNQAVFDLTLTPDATFVYVPRESGGAGDITRALRDAGAAIREWLGYLQSAPNVGDGEARATARTITLTRATPAGMLTTTIDRPTLTATSYRLDDASGAPRFELILDRYALFGDTLWPARIEARGPTGTIAIETRELRANVVAAGAFRPPARAVRLP